jgi:hypothetical protein
MPAIPKYTIVATSNNTDWGKVSGGGMYEHGQSATLTATANAGYRFVEWTENFSPVSQDAEYEFVVEGNRILIANFELRENITHVVTDNVKLYPNPFTNEINVNNSVSVKSIQITTVAGQKVKDVTFNGKSIVTDNLTEGVYFVIVESVTGEKTVYKMIKK